MPQTFSVMTPSLAATVNENEGNDRVVPFISLNKSDNVSDYYNEALPKSDPKFITPLRRWEKQMGFVTPIRWTMVITITLFHIITLIGFFYSILTEGRLPMWKTIYFGNFL